MAVALCAFALVCGTFCLAAARSDARLGWLNEPFTYQDVENGVTKSLVALPGTPVIVVDRGADLFLARSWMPGVGYATVEVPKLAVTLAKPRSTLWIRSDLLEFLKVLWVARDRAGT